MVAFVGREMAPAGRLGPDRPGPRTVLPPAADLLPDDPRPPKFERLTRQEERAGLLDETAAIGTQSGWADRLRERG
jgi:hypothetical protein